MVTAQAVEVHRLDRPVDDPLLLRGFKKTEAGLIPEDWLDLALHEVAQDAYPICYGIVQVGQHVSRGVPVLAIKNLNTNYVTNVHRAARAIERAYARSRVQ